MSTFVIPHEFVGTLRDGRFRWVAIFIGLLVVAARVPGWSYQYEQAGQRTLATKSEDTRWLLQWAARCRRFHLEIGSANPNTFGFVAAALFAIGALASLLPAIRATRVEPIEALRAK